MAVDEQKIIDGVLQLGIKAGADGLINVFGVYLTNFYTDFWNNFSFEYEKKFLAVKGKNALPEVTKLLVEAAEDCALNTFWGIMNSTEWKSLVEPMIESDEDKIYALNAVQNALGWGKISVEEIVPGQKLTLKISTSYESIGYRTKYGNADSPKCYMLTGVAAAFMELVYTGVAGNPSDLVSRNFTAKQTKGTEMGDVNGEIIVTKK